MTTSFLRATWGGGKYRIYVLRHLLICTYLKCKGISHQSALLHGEGRTCKVPELRWAHLSNLYDCTLGPQQDVVQVSEAFKIYVTTA